MNDPKHEAVSSGSGYPCKYCGSIVDLATVKPICILRQTGGIPPVIIFECLCHNQRVIPLAPGAPPYDGED